MEERHATMDPKQSSCTLHPPHVKGKFHFLNSYFVSASAKQMLPEQMITDGEPIKLTTIAQGDRECAEPMDEIAWDVALFAKSGLHLISDDVR